MGAHGVDHYRSRHAQQSQRIAAFRAGSSQRQISHMDYGMALGSDRSAGSDTFRDWRIAGAAVGVVFAHGIGIALYLAGEFGHAYVGIAAVPDQRHLEE